MHPYRVLFGRCLSMPETCATQMNNFISILLAIACQVPELIMARWLYLLVVFRISWAK